MFFWQWAIGPGLRQLRQVYPVLVSLQLRVKPCNACGHQCELRLRQAGRDGLLRLRPLWRLQPSWGLHNQSGNDIRGRWGLHVRDDRSRVVYPLRQVCGVQFSRT